MANSEWRIANRGTVYPALAAGRQCGQPGAGAGVVRVVVVIADPDLEQVTQQVERRGAARLAAEKLQECVDGPGGLAVEVKVGGEQRVARVFPPR